MLETSLIRPSFTKSQIAEKLIKLKGEPLSFDNYPFIRAIYDGNFQNILLKTGRQVSKSTTLANLMLAESFIYSYFSTMFIAPTEFQTNYFSSQRFGEMLEDSVELRKFLFTGPKVKNNIAVKQFSNGSTIIFRYASDNPDRARGFSCDRLCYDEIQDMHPSVFQVINECTAMSPYGFKIFSGTPKSTENVMELFWQLSSQNMWAMKCSGCNKWNLPSIDNIGTKGVICKKCSKGLNVRSGKWVSMSGKHDFAEGFHIPQIILPWHAEDLTRWKAILLKMQNNSPSAFKNEVMGESDSLGSRWLTIEDLRACCAPTDIDMNLYSNLITDKHRKKFTSMIASYPVIVAGVDWSGGGKGVKLADGTIQLISRTVVTIIGILHTGVLDILATKIFTAGTTQPEAVREIIRMCQMHKVSLVGADAGEGALGNGMLREGLGMERVMPFRYSGTMNAAAKWSPQSNSFVVHRTSMIDNFLMLIKRRKIRFGTEVLCKDMFDDILSIYEETTREGVKVWRRNNRTPDDSLHSLVFGWLASRCLKGDLESNYAINYSDVA
jgi:hypothetical protein